MTNRYTVDMLTYTIRISRRIAAPADWLFRSWTDPDQLRLWWDAARRPLVICEVDARVGGTLRLGAGVAGEHDFVATFTRLDPPDALGFDAMGAQGTVSFREAGGVTEMEVAIRCQSAEHLAQFVQMGVADGTARTMDNLVALAGQEQAA